MINRGDVYFVDLDPVKGHEQGRQRPAMIISDDGFNNGPAGLVMIVPITSSHRGIPMHFPVNPPEGGLSTPSVILCDQIRTISTSRLGRRMGTLSPTSIAEVEDRLRILLRL